MPMSMNALPEEVNVIFLRSKKYNITVELQKDGRVSVAMIDKVSNIRTQMFLGHPEKVSTKV